MHTNTITAPFWAKRKQKHTHKFLHIFAGL